MKILPVLLQVTLVYFNVSNGREWVRSSGNETFSSSIQRDISSFCLSGKVCYRNTTRYKRSCDSCRECSCYDDCGLSQNCCFPDDDKYNLVNRTKYECLFPVSIKLNSTEKSRYKSFYMIADNPDIETSNTTDAVNKTDTSPGNMTVPCGQRNVVPWGRLHPVSSKSTGVIYKNEYCAAAHGVNDGVKWLIGVRCNILNKFGDRMDIIQVVEDLLRQEIGTECFLHFFYPGNEDDIEIEQCFQELTSSCTNLDFQLPAGSNMTVNEIREACNSGFTSPYVGSKLLYRNVFCSICNGDFRSRFECRRLLFFGTPIKFTQHFSLVIDHDILKTFVSHDNDGGKRYWTCLRLEKTREFSGCREIKCPPGQLRRFDEKGEIETKHNEIRSAVSPKAANMVSLKYNEGLERTEQIWAEMCQLHPSNPLQRFRPGSFEVGENVFVSQTNMTWSDVIDIWAQEKSSFTFGSRGNKQSIVSNYTQLVWATSSAVGCSKAICVGKYFYVCNYAPAMNYSNIDKPYESSNQSCSQCPKNCTNNALCDCNGIMCLNGAELNYGTCQCDCIADVKTYEPPTCELKCERNGDDPKCGTIFKQTTCRSSFETMFHCPWLCDLCPYADRRYRERSEPLPWERNRTECPQPSTPLSIPPVKPSKSTSATQNTATVQQRDNGSPYAHFQQWITVIMPVFIQAIFVIIN